VNQASKEKPDDQVYRDSLDLKEILELKVAWVPKVYLDFRVNQVMNAITFYKNFELFLILTTLPFFISVKRTY
jgi:hypothetical protein